MKTYSISFESSVNSVHYPSGVLSVGQIWKDAIKTYRHLKNLYKNSERGGIMSLKCDQNGNEIYVKPINI